MSTQDGSSPISNIDVPLTEGPDVSVNQTSETSGQNVELDIPSSGGVRTPSPCSSPPEACRTPKRLHVNPENLHANSPFPIHSNFIIKEKIGQGTWGSVHVAVDRSSGLERAVKKIPKRFSQELARFRQEMLFLKSMDHPNIVRLYETFEDYANLYMVLERCRGGELFDRVTNSRYFSEATAASLIHQMLTSIAYIHHKYVAHRDLKPENFLFLSSSVSSPLKLIDFGLAKRFNSRRKLRTKVGTFYYVSPEVLQGSYDEKCDIWSIGVILYVLLCGSPPFNGPTDGAIVSQVRGGELLFKQSIWDQVTDTGKSLIKSLLNRDVDSRPSAREALQHPWFTLLSPPSLCKMGLCRPLSLPNFPRVVSSKQLCPHENNTYSTTSVGSPGISTSPRFAARSPPFISTQNICASSNTNLSAMGDESSSSASDLTTLVNLAKGLIPRWKRFARHNQLQRAALRVIAQQTLDGDALKDLRTLFLLLDSGNDGTLSGEEVASGLQLLRDIGGREFEDTDACTLLTSDSAFHPPAAEELPRSQSSALFSIMSDSPCPSLPSLQNIADNSPASVVLEGRELTQSSQLDSVSLQSLVEDVALDGSDHLPYSDFLAASIGPEHLESNSVLRAAFRVFDRDGDGNITPAEMRAALGWLQPYVSDSNPTESSNDIQEAIEDILGDVCGSDSIDFENFVRLVRATYHEPPTDVEE